MRAFWFVFQIALMIFGTAFTYIHRPHDEWWWLIPPLFGFCFAYWVTWAIFKIIDGQSKARRLLSRARGLWS
jgi:hypothetical protein